MTYENDDIPMPPHGHVPGFSPRHPDDFFDGVKASVSPDTPPDRLHQTAAFRAGKLYFDRALYWECHQVLDVVWTQTKDPSPERDMVLAFIQLANARLKVAMKQPRAALRLCDMVETHLSRCPLDRAVLGLYVNDMLTRVSETRIASKKALGSI